MKYPKPILELIESYERLPGIGYKTAVRLAFYTIDTKKEYTENFAAALLNFREKLLRCEVCGRINEDNICNICSDENRDNSLICVVEGDKDLISMENLEQYNGMYHVLCGVISPMDNIGPNDINLKNLLYRAQDSKVKEIILATNLSPEGEATASFIAKLLKKTDIKVTRIAQGISFGSDIEYVDEFTLSNALMRRTEI